MPDESTPVATLPDGASKRGPDRAIRLVVMAGIFLTGAYLRLWNLWYSDFQGDETDALFRPPPDLPLSDYFLGQRKGPMQFVVTYLVELVNPGYESEFLTRLPFALAAVASLFFFYKFVDLNFGWWVAALATFFYATNGMFVAMARIAQYQSLILLFAAMALYFFSKAVYDERWRSRGLYLGFLSWALSALSHYDGLLILPFVLYFVVEYHRRYKSLRPFAVPFAMFLLLLAAFYVPFVQHLSESTLDYWDHRLSGSRGKPASSIYTFKVYNPIYTFHFYALYTALGACSVAYLAWRKWATDRIGLAKYGFLVLWLSGVAIFFEGVVNLPWTHIINYLLPLCVFMAVGIAWIFQVVTPKVLRALGATGLAAMFAFMGLQTNAVFVDHSKEYPFEVEPFYRWTFPQVRRDDFDVPIFGFPADRGWSEVRTYLRSKELRGSCFSNEKSEIGSLYAAPCVWDKTDVVYYVWVHRPQNWDPAKDSGRVTDWSNLHDPDFVVTKRGQIVSEVFVIPPTWGKPAAPASTR